MNGAEAGLAEVVSLDRLDRRYAELRLVSPTGMAAVRASIQREGMRNPLVVTTGVQPGQMVLIDGFKRVRALEEMEVKQARVVVVTLDGPASVAAILQCNRPHRGLCDLEEAWVVRSLVRGHHVSQVQVGKLLARHKSWVCRRLQLAEQLDEAVQQDIRLGLLSSAVARELIRLPRGNQQPVSGVIRGHGLSSRQAAQLVSLLLKTDDPDARHQVMSDPLAYLSKRNRDLPTFQDPRLSAVGNAMRNSLLAMSGACDRATRTCGKYAPGGLAQPDAAILAPMVELAARAGKTALSMLDQLVASCAQERQAPERRQRDLRQDVSVTADSRSRAMPSGEAMAHG